MSKNSMLLSRAGVSTVPLPEYPSLQDVNRSGQYDHLIERLFGEPSIVAVGSTDSSDAVRKICDEIATKLASSGKRVVVVSSAAILGLEPGEIPGGADFVPGRAPNTWIWPPSKARHRNLRRGSGQDQQEECLRVLRDNFDTALLECAALGTNAGVREIAALADYAVLVVQAGQASKHRVKQDQRALEHHNIKLAGYILIESR